MITAPSVTHGVFRAAADFACHGIFGTMHPVARSLAQKLAEDGFDRVDPIIEIQVLGFDVENDRMLRVKVYQRAIAFIALRHEQLALRIPMRIGSENRDLGSDIVTWLHAALTQNMGGQRRSRRLAMGAADDDALFVRHHRSQSLGPAYQRDALFVGGLIGHIARLDRAGIDDHVAVLHLLLAVRCKKLQAHLRQPLRLHGRHLV